METWYDRRVAIIGAALLTLIGLSFLLRPTLVRTAAQRPGTSGVMTAATYELTSPLPRHLLLLSDVCPERMRIGGRLLTHDEMPCSKEGFVLFEGSLPSGTVTMQLSYATPVQPPKMGTKTSASDPFFLMMLAAGFLLTALLVLGKNRMPAHARWLALILVAAALTRTGYAAGTPPWVREHDLTGHAQYIEYLREHHALPHALEGWELHQSPAYYVLAALWAEARGAQPAYSQSAQILLQPLNVLLSLACIPVFLWIALRLFGRRSKTAVLLFLLLTALNPGLIFMGSQITNDVLQTLVSLAFFALLLKWWESGTRRDWIFLCVTISLGILTKMSSLLCIPIAGVCLLARETNVRLILRRVLEGGLVTGVLSGWLLFRRIFLENDLSRLGKRTNFEGYESMYVGVRLLDYLVFRPWNLLAMPYNSTREEGFDRRYFWEFAYKSLFVGEWSFGPFLLPLASFLLLAGILGIVASCVALRLGPHRQRHPQFVPVAATAVFLIAALAAYRLTGYTCNQDARFIPLIVVPFTFLLTRGWESLRGRAKTLMKCLLVALGAGQGLLMLMV